MSHDRSDGVGVEVAMQWNDGFKREFIVSQTIFLSEMAELILAGFRSALTSNLNSYIEREGLNKKNKRQLQVMMLEKV